MIDIATVSMMRVVAAHLYARASPLLPSQTDDWHDKVRYTQDLAL